MRNHIDRSIVEKAAKDASPEDPRSTLLKLWDKVDATVRKLDPTELIPLSEFGFDCQPGESAELYGVRLEYGCVMLDIDVHGTVVMNIDDLQEPLKEEVERFLSLLPDGEVVA